MMNHIVDFLLINNEEHGLGFWSEQAFESSHHDFKVIFILMSEIAMHGYH